MHMHHLFQFIPIDLILSSQTANNSYHGLGGVGEVGGIGVVSVGTGGGFGGQSSAPGPKIEHSQRCVQMHATQPRNSARVGMNPAMQTGQKSGMGGQVAGSAVGSALVLQPQ